MVQLRVDTSTTMQQLQDFMKGVGDGHDVRGKRNQDGSITLYSKDPEAFSWGLKRGKRPDKIAAAKDAIGLVFSNTVGTNIKATQSLALVMANVLPTGKRAEVHKDHVTTALTQGSQAIKRQNDEVTRTVTEGGVLGEMFEKAGEERGLKVRSEDHPNLSFEVGNAIARATEHGKRPISLEEAREVADNFIKLRLDIKAGLLDAFTKTTELHGESGTTLEITAEMRDVFKRHVLANEQMTSLEVPPSPKLLNDVFNQAVSEHFSTKEIAGHEDSTSAILADVLEKRGLDNKLAKLDLTVKDLDLGDFKFKDVRKKILDPGKAGSEPVSLEQAREITTARCEKLATQIAGIVERANALTEKDATPSEVDAIKHAAITNLGRPEFVDAAFALRTSAGKMSAVLLDDKASLGEKLEAVKAHYRNVGEQIARAMSEIPLEDRGPDDGAIFQQVYNQVAFGNASGLETGLKMAMLELLASPALQNLEGALNLLQEIAEDPRDALTLGANIRDLRSALTESLPEGTQAPPVEPPAYGRIEDVPTTTRSLLDLLVPTAMEKL